MKQCLLSFLVLGTMTILFNSCDKNDSNPNPAKKNIHLVTSPALGKYLVDKKGRTLYYFSNDANGLSNCSGGCATNWKPLNPDSTSNLYDEGLVAADFSSITSGSGDKQLTYKGWPLYYYTPGNVPEAAGETKGEGVGNIWFVAKPDYTIMIANYQLTGGNGVNYKNDYTIGDGRTSYFTDAKGNTLYLFKRDSSLNNNFTAADFSNNNIWPIYEASSITVPSTLNKSLFTLLDVFGRKQLTYNGWPLYHFGADNMVRGSTKGITIPASQPPGSIWPVATKDAASAPTP
jgi:predicted lipoprotein with Yx(FWY)xxD motif